MDLKNLKEPENLNQRKRQQITIPAKDYSEKQSRNRQFKITEDNKLKIDLKHPAHYILLWIAYVDNLCSIYIVLKKKSVRYLIRIY